VAVYRSNNLSSIGQRAVNAQLKDLTENMAKLGIAVKFLSDSTGDISGPLHGKGLTKGAFNVIAGTEKELGAKTASGSGFAGGGKYGGAVINEFLNNGNKEVITHEVLHGLNRDWNGPRDSWRHERRVDFQVFRLKLGITLGMGQLKQRVNEVQP
jgi:hypothetical protein